MERLNRKGDGMQERLDSYCLPKKWVTYASDQLWAMKNLDGFIDDAKFIESYNIGVDSGQNVGVDEDHDIKWRVHVICWAAKYASGLDGDFVECGVNTGILSLAAMNWIDFDKMPDRKWWLLDTYCGLDEAQQETEEDKKRAHAVNEKMYFECYDLAKNNFSKYKNAVLVKGVIPETLVQVAADKIAYLSIDLNYYLPEIAAGEYFWEKLTKGGIIILDDYAFLGYERQNKEWNKFAKEKDVQILTLPTGQGMILKP